MKHLDTTQERPFALMRRLLCYILKRHKFACLIVVLGLLGSALASLSMTLFMQALIDDYILPLTRAAVQDYAPLAQFRVLNEALRDSARNANRIVNITMPVNGSLSNISYVLCAIAGGLLALGGSTGLTIGALIAFLNLNKSFNQPVTMLSQQVSSVVMATAGAARAFALLDETPEQDGGDTELVNVREEADGTLTETA